MEIRAVDPQDERLTLGIRTVERSVDPQRSL